MSYMRGTLAERFWAKVDRRGDNECWPWLAGKNNKGYGRIYGSAKKRHLSAHRAAWEVTHGKPPADMCVCHSCDNPGCCNPAHLFLGTYADNNHDRDRKKRHTALRGQEHPRPGKKLTENDVREIRHRVAVGESQRAVARSKQVAHSTVGDIIRGQTWTWLKE
jgi:hypothetical protein